MGWKNIKEHYGIGHIVSVKEWGDRLEKGNPVEIPFKPCIGNLKFFTPFKEDGRIPK